MVELLVTKLGAPAPAAAAAPLSTVDLNGARIAQQMQILQMGAMNPAFYTAEKVAAEMARVDVLFPSLFDGQF